MNLQGLLQICFLLVLFSLLHDRSEIVSESVLESNMSSIWEYEPHNNLTRVARAFTPGHICNKFPCENIGKCIENGNNYRCDCYGDFYEPNVTGGECDQSFPVEKNYCKRNPCKNGGICYRLWGNYFCECSSAFTGVICKRPRPPSVVRMSKPTFVYNIDSVTAYFTPFLLYFETLQLGSNIQMKFVTGEGLSFTINEKSFIQRSPSTYSNIFTDSIVIRRKLQQLTEVTIVYFFVYTYHSKDKNMIIKIRLSNENVPNFRADYPIYVHHHPNDCVPDVVLEDCWHSSLKAPNIRRRHNYLIRSRAHQDCSKYGSYFNHIWKIYQLTYPRPVPMDEGPGKNLIDFQVKQPSPVELYIAPFSLKYGRYALQLQVKETITKIFDGKKKSHHNKDLCFLEIHPENLAAVIKGGENRKTSINKELVLDGTDSYDPNEPETVKTELTYTWACEYRPAATPKTNICQGLLQTIFTGAVYRIPSNSLEVDDEYSFKLTVTATDVYRVGTIEGTFTQKITVVNGDPPVLNILCLRNCDKNHNPNPHELTALKVVCIEDCTGSTAHDFYEWSVTSTDTSFSITWSVDTYYSKNNPLLFVKEDVFTAGYEYIFTVSGGQGGNVRGEYSYRIQIISGPTVGSCNVDSRSGISGITKFNFKCSGFLQADVTWPLRYEFYQSCTQTSNSNLGVLMFYLTEPIAENVVLMAGEAVNNYKTTVSIKVIDVYGLYVVSNIDVEVTPMSNQMSESQMVNQMIEFINGTDTVNSIPSLMAGGDMSGVVQLILVISEAVKTITNADTKKELNSQLITALDKVLIHSLSAVAQVSYALCKLIKDFDQKSLDRGTALVASSIIFKLGDVFQSRAGETLYQLDTAEVKQIVLTVLESISNVIEPTLHTQTADEIVAGGTDDYPLYFDIVNKASRDFDDYAANILEAIENLGKVLSERLIEKQNPIMFHTNLGMWVQVETPSNLAGRMLGASQKNGTGVIISPSLATALEKEFPSACFAVAIIQGNPFWWQPVGRHISSDIVSITIHDKNGSRHLGQLSSNIDLYMNINNMDTVHLNVVMQLTLDPNKLEDTIPVHRVNVDKGDMIWLTFQPFADPNFKLKVVILYEFRPSLVDFTSRSTVIPQGSNLNVKSQEAAQEDGTYFYIGLLPDDFQAAAQSGNKFQMSYSFSIHKVKCESWNSKQRAWLTEGCSIGPSTSKTNIHCQCNHLSIFSGSFLVAPNKIDPIHDAHLFLRVVDNPAVVIFMVIFLLFCILLLLWARRKDNSDYYKRKVIILEDNVPGEWYAYLVTVYTGGGRNCGTTSKVGIRLVGTVAKSKPHILNDTSDKLLQRNSKNWFVLYTYKSLGDLTYVELWHNSSGHYPAWYCQDIVVRDMQTRNIWVFLVRRWLCVSRARGSTHCIIATAKKNEQQAVKVLFADNTNNKFREDHLWLSIFLRFPKSNFTRCQRVGVLMSGMMLSMLANIMFYGIPKGTKADQIDGGGASISMRSILIGVESALISMPVTIAIMFLFKKSKPKSMKRAQDEAEKLRAIITEIVGPNRVNNSGEMSHGTCGVAGNSSDKQLDESAEEKKRSQYLLPCWCLNVAWSICFISTGIAAYLIMLYSLSFGRVKSTLWLTSTISTIVSGVFVIEPLKIMVIAMILTLIFKSQPKVVDLERGIPLELDVSEQKRIVKKSPSYLAVYRTLPMYKPMPQKDVERLRVIESRRRRTGTLVFDFIMFGVYMVLLYVIVMGSKEHLAYHSMRNVVALLVEDAYGSDMPFEDIQNYEDFITYMKQTYIPALHKTELYNGQKIEEIGWIADYSSQLVGVARLRQLRVRNDTCSPPLIFKNSMRCDEEYSMHAADQESYGLSWSPRNSSTRIISERAKIPWIYQTDWDSGSCYLQGDLSWYPGGGYIIKLGRNRANSLVMVEFLDDFAWIDELTRVILVECTLYNANRNLFNVVTLMVETSATGTYVTSYNIQTVTLLYVTDNIHIGLLGCFALFVIVLVLFLIRQILAIKELSFRVYMSTFWTILDFVIVFLGFVCIGIYFARSYYVTTLLRTLEAAEGNEFVSFYEACLLQKLLDCILGFIICISTVRLWKILRINNVFRTFEIAMALAGRSLLSITIVCILVFLILSIDAYLFWGYKGYYFRTISHSFSTLFAISMFWNIDYRIFTQGNRIIGTVFLIILCITVTIYLVNLIITVFCMGFTAAREKKNLQTEEYSLMTYLKEEFQYHVKQHVLRRQKKKQNKVRLRGGADEREAKAASSSHIEKVEKRTKANEVTISHFKIEAMRLLTINILNELTKSQSSENSTQEIISINRLNAMAAITLDEYENKNRKRLC